MNHRDSMLLEEINTLFLTLSERMNDDTTQREILDEANKRGILSFLKLNKNCKFEDFINAVENKLIKLTPQGTTRKIDDILSIINLFRSTRTAKH